RSQLISAAARVAAAKSTVRSFSNASRRDSLCLNVMSVTPSHWFALRREELAHVRRTRRRAWENVHPKALQDQPQCALMLVQRRGLIATFGLRAHRHPPAPPAARGVRAARRVEHGDRQAVLLEHRPRDARRDGCLRPAVCPTATA